MKYKLILFALSLLFLTNVGHADFARVGAFAGAGFNNVSIDNSSLQSSRENKFAGGASLEAAMAPDFGVETGFLMSKDRLQIPLFARFLGGQTFTIALGPVGENITGDNEDFRFGLAVAPGLNFQLTKNRNLDVFVETRVMRLFRDGIGNFSDNNTGVDAIAGLRLALR